MKQILLLFLVAPLFTFGQWTQIGSDIDGKAADDKFGGSVSLNSDGTIVAIGASANDDVYTSSGHVRVFKNTGGVWNKIGVDLVGEGSYNYFGFSISLSSDGSKVAVGGWGANTSAGYVQIFENINGTWTQMGSDINGEANDDRSGYSVSLSSDGTVVAIGAWKNNGNGSQAGHVRIYQYATNTWNQVGEDIDGEAAQDWSGQAVSLSSDGSIVAIGAKKNWNNGGYNGHVRVFENILGDWIQKGSDIDAKSYEDDFGGSVCLSSDGSILAVGAIHTVAGGSHVRVYQYSANTWTQIGATFDGATAYNNLGSSVSFSDDGSILAIGAPINNGNGAGTSRVYQYSANTWTQIGSDIDGEADGDFSGTSVSLSSDGTILAVGASWNDGVNGTDSGHVKVYNSTSLSVTSNSFGPLFKAYPNPSFGNTNIELGDSYQKVEISIFNLLGKEVLNKTYNNTNSIKLDTQLFTTGVYVVKVESNSNKASLKLVVK